MDTLFFLLIIPVTLDPYRLCIETYVTIFFYTLKTNSPYVVCFLQGNSPASEFYMLTFRNTLFHLYMQVSVKNFTPTCP